MTSCAGSKYTAALCLYDLSKNGSRVLDLHSAEPGEVLIDSSSGWIGYQTGQGRLVFYSAIDERKVMVIRWGLKLDLLNISEGVAYWLETLPRGVPGSRLRATNLNKDSPFPLAFDPPYNSQTRTGSLVYTRDDDIALVNVPEQYCVLLILVGAILPFLNKVPGEWESRRCDN